MLYSYNLLDQFQNIVAGFSDSFALCHNKCGTTFKSVSLKTMASLLLDEGMAYVESGVERATAIYNILEQLANQGKYIRCPLITNCMKIFLLNVSLNQ